MGTNAETTAPFKALAACALAHATAKAGDAPSELMPEEAVKFSALSS